ncbi:helix-turn-helix transcriptional regulator [Actinomycetospora endophytica]|uniref:Helix-turn-helix transcriptional regulator n=1 Tax=Actinomycetospora endophytica TaxID=2291215 RepID=A0ABS8P2A1_9PSEU|nr:helix-turn-helix transcriptional regulator [Actinomycetospora endophytica]MCD2192193.1 helix-turn-helix transcriptional regulator [Actinomycetospora endophytica]
MVLVTTAELGAFLRSRRERISPSEVGLPPGGRRRTPGLRREELALISGVSTSWYTFLEQGRDVRPSAQVLDALAGALSLTGDERDHLLRLGGLEPAAPEPGPETVDPGLADLVDALGDRPAYVTAASFDVLAINDAARKLFAGMTGTPGNVALWVFTDPRADEVLVDREEVARGVLARLRAATARHPDDARVAAVVETLRRDSPDAAAWWSRQDVRDDRSGRKRIRHPELGEVTLTHTVLHPAERPDLTLVVYGHRCAPRL